MMRKSEFYQTIKALAFEQITNEPAFVIAGRYYRANGVYMAPEDVKRHRGVTLQFYLKGDTMPEHIPGAEMIAVDSWIVASDLAREALGVKSVSLSRGKHLEYIDTMPAAWMEVKRYYQMNKFIER